MRICKPWDQGLCVSDRPRSATGWIAAVSEFHQALTALLAKDLYCRKCKAMNVPNASPTIEPDQTGTRAQCSQCNAEGPIENFQPPKENRCLD